MSLLSSSLSSNVHASVWVVAAKVCPTAPPGAQAQVDVITGYILWGVGILFGLAVVTGIGAVVGGRFLSMPHASKTGVVSLVVVFCCVIGYLVLPGIVDAMLGKGCI